MNEDDVQELERQALADIPETPEIELKWIEAQLRSLQEQRQVFAAQFKMWKHMRDDKRMKETAANLKEAKDIISYLEERRRIIAG